PEEARRFAARTRPVVDRDESYRAWANAIFIPFTDPKAFTLAIDAARAIKYRTHQALALAFLASQPAANRSDLVKEAIASLRRFQYEDNRVEVIEVIA